MVGDLVSFICRKNGHLLHLVDVEALIFFFEKRLRIDFSNYKQNMSTLKIIFCVIFNF